MGFHVTASGEAEETEHPPLESREFLPGCRREGPRTAIERSDGWNSPGGVGGVDRRRGCGGESSGGWRHLRKACWIETEIDGVLF
ncbi:hypothetical protein SDJN03_02543, partial [Cucurbita argyrosperma subsp. sororia]